MKRVKVIRNGVITNQADFPDVPTEWIKENSEQGSFGKPERWIPENQLSKEEKAKAIEMREIPDVLGEPRKEYKFAAEFTIVIEDVTAEYAQKELDKQASKARHDFLKSLKGKNLSNAEIKQVVEAMLMEM